MSHHLDSPASRRDPRLNLPDLYVFDGDVGATMVMTVNTSLAGPDRPRGFHPEARYEFRVHLDGQDREGLTYRFAFGPADDDGVQDVVLEQLTGPDAGDDGAEGRLLGRGRTEEVVELAGGARMWAGSAADPFYLDLHELAHIVEGLQEEKPIDLAGWNEDEATNSFAGSRVEAIVLEIPAPGAEELVPGRRIGVWAVAELATDAGGWRRVNRAAIPMMWPLLRARGGADESEEYARDTLAHPSQDHANDSDRLISMVAAAARFAGTADADAHARAVADRLLPDVLPYTVGTPAAFGLVSLNGRTLADDAPAVMYRLLTDSAIPSGLRPSSAAETRQDAFPYVVPAAER
ncbi:DUF4331 family protein [Actinomycetospora sp. CA-053990]|uniref:DUF4331 family protein n=1 Tax=Actinomycetospora sp. CA-053990 TaxID=3239891 RepID=UPI003D9227BD